MVRIGLVIAMPEEVRPIVRRIGRFRKERLGGFPLYRCQLDGREICLIRSGMGSSKAAAAALSLIAALRPDQIISAGFGGAVRKGLETGDIVVAGQVVSLTDGKFSDAAAIENGPVLTSLRACLEGRGLRIEDGCIVTTSSIVRKDEVSRMLPEGLMNPVLDMETSAVAEAAACHGIPLVAVRAISDPAEEELLFSIEDLCDRELNIRIGRVILTMLRNPRVLRQMLRLARNAKVCGNNLAVVLERVIRCA
jgi:adenosylhomocysteine nucleosidase